MATNGPHDEIETLRAENARLTAALADAQRDAERATRAKDLFISSVSHELRSPLSTMLMQAQLLKSGDLGPAELTRTSEAIERATQRQVQLIEDVLDVSRIVAGKLTYEMQPVNFAGVVRTALEVQKPAMVKKGLELVVEVADVGMVNGDYGRLQQVVRHLLTNATRFSSKGHTVKVSLAKQGKEAVLTVQDPGAGIDAAQLPHLFTRFTDPDVPRPKPSGGLGFGLAVSHTILAHHAGTIAAASDGAGKGTTVTVRLPLAG